MNQCEKCTQPITETAYLCTDCGNLIRDDLDTIADLYGYLEDSIAKLTKFSRGRLGGRSSDTQTPFNPAASHSDVTVTTTIANLATAIQEGGAIFEIRMTPPAGLTCIQRANAVTEIARRSKNLDLTGSYRPVGAHGDCGHLTCRAITEGTVEPLTIQRAQWIAGWHMEWVRHSPHALTIAEHVKWAAEELTAAVDRPEDRRFLGLCGNPGTHLKTCDCEEPGCTNVGECDQPIYAKTDEKHTKCVYCRTTHNVDAKTRDNLTLAADYLFTASEIEKWTGGLDKPIRPERIRQWKARGKIADRGHAKDTDTGRTGDPLYRLGDVLDLAVQDMSNEAAKTA